MTIGESIWLLNLNTDLIKTVEGYILFIDNRRLLDTWWVFSLSPDINSSAYLEWVVISRIDITCSCDSSWSLIWIVNTYKFTIVVTFKRE